MGQRWTLLNEPGIVLLLEIEQILEVVDESWLL